jgi:hypothetical protein
MLIAAIAILSGFAGIGISYYAQAIEAKAADTHSVDDWNEFVRTMGGGRK